MQVTIREGIVGPPVPDSYMDEDTPDNKYGTSTTIKVGVRQVLAAMKEWRGIFSYPLDAIPVGSSIVSAIVRTNVITASAGARAGHLLRVTSTPWNESQVTWNNREFLVSWTKAGGDSTTDDQVPYDLPTATGDADSDDLTALVNDAIASRGNLLHLIWRLASGSLPSRWVEVASGETATVGYRPRLIVTYNPPPMWYYRSNVRRRSA